MRILPYVIAAAAISSFALASPSSAGSLVHGSASASSTITELADGNVQKVHRWHCQRRKGWYKGKSRWHRHAKACRDNGYVDPYPYSGYGGAPLPYYGYWDWRRERRNWLWD